MSGGDWFKWNAKNAAQIITNTCHVNVWLCVKGNITLLTVVVDRAAFKSVKLLSCCGSGSVLQQLNLKKESP